MNTNWAIYNGYVTNLPAPGLDGLKIFFGSKTLCIGNCAPKDSDLFRAQELKDLPNAKKLVVKTTPGNKFPDHYLKKMTKSEIDRYSYLFELKTRDLCRTIEFVEGNNCRTTSYYMAEVEKNNLYYVNKLISHDQLKKVYEDSYGRIASLPVKISVKEQWKRGGTMLLAAVVGFITGGGPVGFITGIAGAVAKQLAEDKARYQAIYANKMDIAAAKLDEVVKLKEQNDRDEMISWLLPAIAGTTAAGMLYFLIKE